MSINDLKQKLPSYAKDIKLNLSGVLSEEGSLGLSVKQIHLIALASAFATKNQELVDSMLAEVSATLAETDIEAAKAAAVIMGMNNIYYRFVHLVSDKEYAKLPAKLRMNVMANPGVEQIDFELMSLAVSAINGCGLCIDSHTKKISADISKEGIQSTVRIAAVIFATAQALSIA
ncbi:MAG: carboxymuconolactone decarboxylase family protein [Pseudomonadota bacterium]